MRNRDRQRGFTLIAVLVVVTLMMIALAAAAPHMGTQIKHDREEELVHRANQYVRAIQLFYRKFNRFPNSVEELENTNNVRFLRRRYPDPITGKDEWRLIRFGQAKPKQLPAWQKGGAGKSGSGITPASGLGGSQQGSGTTSGSSSGLSGSQQASDNPSGGVPGAVNASDISKPLTGSPTLGVGGIVGVSSTSEKKGLKEINGKTKYNEWEFVYDPTLDPLLRGGGNFGGQGNPTNPNGPQGPAGGQPNPQQPQPMQPTPLQRK